MAVMLWSYISSKNATPYGTGLVGLEISLQVLLGWSLICPTIPCIRPLAMRFTTGGAIVLAGETQTTGDEPSTTRSHTDLHGLPRRHSQYLKGSQQQEQDEIELNPHVIDRSASAIRISHEDDGHDNIEAVLPVKVVYMCHANTRSSQKGSRAGPRHEILLSNHI